MSVSLPGSYGRKLTDDSRHVDDGLSTNPKRIAVARQRWPEGIAEDFEQTSRRRWRSRVTGHEYRKVSGTPFLNPDAPVDVWFVQHGRFVFLTGSDR